MKITESETELLINNAENGKFVQLSFGIGWVELRDEPDNEWAFKLIAENRSTKEKA